MIISLGYPYKGSTNLFVSIKESNQEFVNDGCVDVFSEWGEAIKIGIDGETLGELLIDLSNNVYA